MYLLYFFILIMYIHMYRKVFKLNLTIIIMEIEKIRKPKVNLTTSINMDLWTFAREHNIPWNELIEFAIQFKMAEVEIGVNYPKNKLSETIIRLNQVIEDKGNRINILNEQLYNLSENKELQEKEKPIGEELKEVFGDDIKDQ